jgi:hypothetical protein
VTTAKQWSAEAIEAALAAQRIALAPGRAERIARAQQALLDAALTGDAADFDADAPGFILALAKCK